MAEVAFRVWSTIATARALLAHRAGVGGAFSVARIDCRYDGTHGTVRPFRAEHADVSLVVDGSGGMRGRRHGEWVDEPEVCARIAQDFLAAIDERGLVCTLQPR